MTTKSQFVKEQKQISTRTKVIITTLVFGVLAFLSSPNGPLGGFWAPPADFPVPTGVQVPLFMVLGVVEALLFGLGASFLIFGYPLVKAIAPASPRLTMVAYLSIFWLLISWWPHDSLHIHSGLELNMLLVIEYGFHVTLMVAGIILAYFFLTLLGQRVKVI
ncbi:MAG: hypothetical protein L6R45_32225 [Anaerolineae bacterium]|nr:hypothetical protein [Anaerolineae bacterium]